MMTKENYADFLAQVRELTGIDSLRPNESGLASVRVDDAYNVNLQFVEATGKILLFVEVAELPPDAPRAIYRDLLVGGLFGKETSGGSFTIEPDTETVIYNYFFDLDPATADPEEFVDAIEKILQLCDMWAERIQGKLHEAGMSEDVNDVFGHPLGHTIFRA